MSKQSKPLTLVLTFMIGSAVARLKVSVLITEKPTMEKSKSHQAHIRTAGGVWFLYMCLLDLTVRRYSITQE